MRVRACARALSLSHIRVSCPARPSALLLCASVFLRFCGCLPLCARHSRQQRIRKRRRRKTQRERAPGRRPRREGGRRRGPEQRLRIGRAPSIAPGHGPGAAAAPRAGGSALCSRWDDVFDSKELTNGDRFAGVVVMRRAAILKHKEKSTLPRPAPRCAASRWGGKPRSRARPVCACVRACVCVCARASSREYCLAGGQPVPCVAHRAAGPPRRHLFHGLCLCVRACVCACVRACVLV